MRKPRLTRRQLQLLRKLKGDMEGDQPCDLLAEVELERLCRWLANETFRQRLGQMILALRVRGDLALAHAATRAGERLAGGVSRAGIDQEQHRLCLDVALPAPGERGRKPAQKRTARTLENDPPARIFREGGGTGRGEGGGTGRGEGPEPDLKHPDVPPEEARELLERLSRP